MKHSMSMMAHLPKPSMKAHRSHPTVHKAATGMKPKSRMSGKSGMKMIGKGGDCC